MRAYIQLFFFVSLPFFRFQSSNCRARVYVIVTTTQFSSYTRFHAMQQQQYNILRCFCCNSFHFNNLIVRLLKRKRKKEAERQSKKERKRERKWARDVDFGRVVFLLFCSPSFHCVRASIIELNTETNEQTRYNRRYSPEYMKLKWWIPNGAQTLARKHTFQYY